LLTLYQLLRTAMVEAIETRPGLDPDRASFTTALLTARDQLITAQGIDPHPATASAVDRLGMIGHAVLASLLPARRLRYSNCNVKCTTSRYHARDDGRPALSTDIIAIDIAPYVPHRCSPFRCGCWPSRRGCGGCWGGCGSQASKVRSGAVNPAGKLACVIAGMSAGADCIDELKR
jgi:hypothetical protein